jgi:hypothetical protein
LLPAQAADFVAQTGECRMLTDIGLFAGFFSVVQAVEALDRLGHEAREGV